MSLSRREFLLSTAAGAAACCAAPSFGAPWFRRIRFDESDRVLVVLQLAGGNDGLSTVIPFSDPAYHNARRAVRHDERGVLRLDDRVGLHPALKGLKALYDSGFAAIVQGVGYPNPNRSHFESFEIWHAADPRGRDAGTGWIGRFADALPDDRADPNLVIHVGEGKPFSLHARRRHAVAFSAPEAYRWVGTDAERRVIERAAPSAPGLSGRDGALEKIRRTLHEAHASSDDVRRAASSYRAKATYPRNGLAGALNVAAALIAGGLKTRVFSVELAGFDTHVQQRARHDALMATLGDALKAFFDDLSAHGLADRVTLLAFSEFGRRVEENGSAGTDHGVAGPLFVVGKKVSGGIYGAHPSLTDLDRGDLRHTTDFRSVYATLIDRWLGGDADAVLGAAYPRLDFLKA